MNHKIGDKVRVKDINWYNENRDYKNVVDCGEYAFIPDMVKYCGKIFTVESFYRTGYKLAETDIPWTFNDEMLEGISATTKHSIVDVACDWFADLDFEMEYLDGEGLFDKEKFIKDFRKKMINYEHNGC